MVIVLDMHPILREHKLHRLLALDLPLLVGALKVRHGFLEVVEDAHLPI